CVAGQRCNRNGGPRVVVRVTRRLPDREVAEVANADGDARALRIFEKPPHRASNLIDPRVRAADAAQSWSRSVGWTAHRARLIEHHVDIERRGFGRDAVAGAVCSAACSEPAVGAVAAENDLTAAPAARSGF